MLAKILGKIGELELIACAENYYIIKITKTWWDETCDQDAYLNDYTILECTEALKRVKEFVFM